MILRLKRQHVNTLKKEAEKVHPIEACAMLFGRLTQKEAVVKRVVVAPNKLQSTARFEINPEVFANAFTQADKEELDFIGLFHSHPAPPTPSLIDLKYMKLWGDALWLILSSINGSLAAFQMSNGKVREITIKVELQTI
ncbi:MAG: M67 family metallopeptidase [Candidatus Bathyarchaeota archaeon]|nr:M67 family metallopeptidase [Candidatus Bathyarchaeota archaeon]